MAIQPSSDPSILEGLMVTVADDKSKCGHKIWKFNRSGRVLICHCYLLLLIIDRGAWWCVVRLQRCTYIDFLATRVIWLANGDTVADDKSKCGHKILIYMNI